MPSQRGRDRGRDLDLVLLLGDGMEDVAEAGRREGDQAAVPAWCGVHQREEPPHRPVTPTHDGHRGSRAAVKAVEGSEIPLRGQKGVATRDGQAPPLVEHRRQRALAVDHLDSQGERVRVGPPGTAWRATTIRNRPEPAATRIVNPYFTPALGYIPEGG